MPVTGNPRIALVSYGLSHYFLPQLVHCGVQSRSSLPRCIRTTSGTNPLEGYAVHDRQRTLQQ